MPDSTLLITFTAVQQLVLLALVAGQSITAAAKTAGIHRTTVHLWTRQHPDFARAILAARQDQADRVLDELTDLADSAINTFRHLLSDENASPSTRLKAAMEIVKLVEAQRPTLREATLVEVKCDKIEADFALSQIAHTPQPATPVTNVPVTNVGRNALCPCGSRLKFKRCCANLARQARAA